MRTIAHLSDLHFGRDDPAVTEGLLTDLAGATPDLVAISGDLTQRARTAEFAAARAFIDRMTAPVVAVPGNHDVPLYNVARRAFHPLKRFRRYISSARHPFFVDDEVAVLGINSARALALANGRISYRQATAIRSLFAQAPAAAFRILVTHHPLMPPPGAPERAVVGRAALALAAVAAAGIELILTGHYHQAFSSELAAWDLGARRSVLVSQAGTALSTRRREEPNSYNLLRVEPGRLACERRAWDGRRFVTAAMQRYARAAGLWSPVA